MLDAAADFDEVQPKCDYCDGPQPRVGEDWNGETGNHFSCEKAAGVSDSRFDDEDRLYDQMKDDILTGHMPNPNEERDAGFDKLGMAVDSMYEDRLETASDGGEL